MARAACADLVDGLPAVTGGEGGGGYGAGGLGGVSVENTATIKKDFSKIPQKQKGPFYTY